MARKQTARDITWTVETAEEGAPYRLHIHIRQHSDWWKRFHFLPESILAVVLLPFFLLFSLVMVFPPSEHLAGGILCGFVVIAGALMSVDDALWVKRGNEDIYTDGDTLVLRQGGKLWNHTRRISRADIKEISTRRVKPLYEIPYLSLRYQKAGVARFEGAVMITVKPGAPSGGSGKAPKEKTLYCCLEVPEPEARDFAAKLRTWAGSPKV